MTSCLADEVLAAWSAGEITDAERAAAIAHAEGCARCRALVGTVFGETASAAATIGRYEVVGPLAGGGMGVVLRGRDPVLDRAVAIKLAHASQDDPDLHARMLREAQALAKLEHPNVVAVHDCGVSGGEVFLAMALVEGVALSMWMGDPHPLAARLRVLTDVAAGLAAIHDKGLVHRDIKPDNIMVRASGQALIVDFGLARASAFGAGSGVAGTREYIAPEVLAGEAATPASDQYAWWVLVREVLRECPMPSRQRAKIDAAIARGTSRTRFADMHAAAAALHVRPRWPIAVAVAGVALVGGVIAMVAMREDAADPCAWQPTAWTASRANVLAGVTAAGADTDRVRAAIDERVAATTSLRRAACKRADQYQLACLDRTWGDTTSLFRGLAARDREEVWSALDDLGLVLPPSRCTRSTRALVAPPPTDPNATVTTLALTLMETARAPLESADRLAKIDAMGDAIAATKYAPLVARWHTQRAAALQELGRHADAIAALDRGELAAEASGDDDLRTEIALNRLAHAYSTGVRDTATLEAKATALVDKLDNPVRRAELADMRGSLLVARGDAAGGVAALREALAVYKELAIDASEREVRALQNLGAALQMTNDLAAAQQMFDTGLDRARRRYGPDGMHTIEMRGARASNLLYAGKTGEAKVELAAVVDALQRTAGEGSHALLMAQLVLCEAENTVERCFAALGAAERAYGPNHVQLVAYLGLYGNALRTAGRAKDALVPLARAIALPSSISPGEHVLARAWWALALHAADPEDNRARETARAIEPELAKVPGTEQLRAELAAAFPD